MIYMGWLGAKGYGIPFQKYLFGNAVILCMLCIEIFKFQKVLPCQKGNGRNCSSWK